MSEKWDGTDYHYMGATSPAESGKALDQLLNAAEVGLLVHGIRALIDPSIYPDNPFTNNAKAIVQSQFGVPGGYDIPSEFMELAFPPKNNLLK